MPNRRCTDLTGKVVGDLTVVGLDHIEDKNGRKRKFWLCECSCGNMTVVRTDSLTSGSTTSCGCAAVKKAKELSTSHGGSYTRLYSIWSGMKDRCRNPNSPSRRRYGGRGIDVCDEWFNSYEVFRAWAISNGYGEELSIDRIDNNGNYCPENCRWVTNKQNSRNRECNITVNYNGKNMALSESAELAGIRYETIRSRYHNGDRGEYLFRPINKNLSCHYRKEKNYG